MSEMENSNIGENDQDEEFPDDLILEINKDRLASDDDCKSSMKNTGMKLLHSTQHSSNHNRMFREKDTRCFHY